MKTVSQEFSFGSSSMIATIEHNGLPEKKRSYVRLTFEETSCINMCNDACDVQKINISFTGEYERHILLGALKMFVLELENNPTVIDSDLNK